LALTISYYKKKEKDISNAIDCIDRVKKKIIVIKSGPSPPKNFPLSTHVKKKKAMCRIKRKKSN